MTTPPAHTALLDEKVGLYAMVFLANMGWGVMTPVLANVQAEFGVSVFEVALANSVFGLSRLILDVPIGALMDRVDQRLLRFVGAATLAFGSVLCALAGDFPTLLLGRLLHGAGAAVIQVTNMVWISRMSTDERRGRDLGIFQAVHLAGASLSPAVAGTLADLGTWRTAFWFSGIVALLGFLPMLIGSQAGWKHLSSRAAHVEHEVRSEANQVEKVDATRVLITANAVTFVLIFSMSGFHNTALPLFASNVLGLNAGTIGLALGATALMRFVMSLVGGEVSDRFGRRAVLVPGLIVIGCGILMFNAVADLGGFWVAIVVLSFGRFSNNVPVSVLADHTPSSSWNVLMGINRAVGDLGLILGPIVAGLLLETLGYGQSTMLWAALVWAGAVAVLVGVPETRQRRSLLGGVRAIWKGRPGGGGQ